MIRESIPVSVVLEGSTDSAVAERLLAHVGLTMGDVYGFRGKSQNDRRLPDYNNAARFARWFVLRDLDDDAPCAPELVRALLPSPSPHMRHAHRGSQDRGVASRGWDCAEPFLKNLPHSDLRRSGPRCGPKGGTCPAGSRIDKGGNLPRYGPAARFWHVRRSGLHGAHPRVRDQ